MKIYGNDAYLHLAKVNLPKRLEQYKAQLIEIQDNLSETSDNQKKRLKKIETARDIYKKNISLSSKIM